MAAPYSFVSRWHLSAAVEDCWAEIERMLRPAAARGWWRGVELAEHPAVIAPGERLVLSVRSPLGYRLRVRLTLTEVEPGRVLAAEGDGDLSGRGCIVLVPVADRETIVETTWDVRTRLRWMNATAPLLRPVFVRAHRHVMAVGERGLRAALTAVSVPPLAAASVPPRDRISAPKQR